jgi:hypothetical protein
VKLSNEAQEEQFREIGVYLRQAREEKSISIDEVSMHTRIRAAFDGQKTYLKQFLFKDLFVVTATLLV